MTPKGHFEINWPLEFEILFDLVQIYSVLRSFTILTFLWYSIPGATLLLTVLYSVTIAVSSYSNALVLWIVSTTKSLQNVNNFHIANLAVSDIMLALLCTPFQFWAALVQQWVLPEFMCKLCPFIQDMCVNVNIFNLILIAQDRWAFLLKGFNKVSKHR